MTRPVAVKDNGQMTTDKGPKKMPRPTLKRRSPARSKVRGGFTMIELLMVIIIIGILIALLLPAIQSAVRTARNAAVSSEINQLAQALESFRSKYGDYPPSRVLLVESGNYAPYIGSNSSLTGANPNDPDSPANNDITVGQLAQRTLIAMRKFFPRVVFTTTGTAGPPLYVAGKVFYDFNGNGLDDSATPYVLHGHECLVFFLGGIPQPSTLPITTSTTFGMTGFGKDPTNPFFNNITGANMSSSNRQPPFFEFNTGRLFVDPNTVMSGTTTLVGIPGYYDSLGNEPPIGPGGTNINFYAYFSGYGNGSYDANDVNFAFESGPNGVSPIELLFQYGTITYKSPSPNPYTTTLSTTMTAAGAASGTATVTYQKAQTFQIISSGADGLYGVGGQFVPRSLTNSSATTTLPFDSVDTFAGTAVETNATVRTAEKDNLTNFTTGTLQ
jgi:prepilin-type N-terminal cleavage/methylation domain-containing protein